jgi:hypothetical protein
MRHDHNSALWAAAASSRPSWTRRLAFGGVAVAVGFIATLPLRDHVAPVAECRQSWPYLDAGCSGGSNVTHTLPVRVIGIDRNAPAVIAKAAPAVVPTSAPLAEPVIAASAVPTPAAPEPLLVAAPQAATDGAGAPAVRPPPPVASAPISEEDLTFKAGGAYRPGAAAVKEEAPPEPPKTKAKPRRNVAQTYELSDGRRVTVHRGSRDVVDPEGRRVRAADVGARIDDGGFFGWRREPRNLGGLY